MQWIVWVLIWLGSDHTQDALCRANAAAATGIAYASLHEAAPTLEAKRPRPAPAPCPGGKCPPIKPAPKK